MFEDKTFENIMDELLSNVDETVDTREGSIIYDACAPIALEIEQLYADLGLVLDECFADTASYYYLIKRAAERGIFVKEGTKAQLKVSVEPDQDINGMEFSIGEYTYTGLDGTVGGYRVIECTEAGVDGNNLSDDIIPISDATGSIEAITAVAVYVAGTNDEDEESLRKRYFDSFVNVAFGGNKAEYKTKADDFENVYGCKVYPTWNGGGTVKLKILGSGYKAASAGVISEIQQAFDPTQDGTGVGIAPIDHIVTVDTVTEVPINLNMTIAYTTGFSWADISERFATAFEDYLLESRKTWEDNANLIVRIGQIESILLDFECVDNVTSVSINGGTSAENYIVPGDSVPIGGTYNG